MSKGRKPQRFHSTKTEAIPARRQKTGNNAQRNALDAQFAAALRLHQQGHLAEAAQCYKAILKVDPKHFDSLHHLGVIHHQAGNNPVAAQLLAEALKIRSDQHTAFSNYGLVLIALHRYDEAVKSYNRALTLKPDYVEALNNRGIALNALMRYEEALESYNRALTLKPDYADALDNRGNSLNHLERYDEALESYNRALTLEPDHVGTLNNRGITLHNLKRYDEALESFNRALVLEPNYAEALNNRGITLNALMRYDEALESYNRALTFKPDYAEALNNRGNALKDLRRYDEALESYNQAFTIKPDYEEAHNNECVCRLLMGDFIAGLQQYEWRWKAKDMAPHKRDILQPLWLGREPLAGKTILLHAEQGLGDTLQFCRYAALVKQLGAKVIMEVQPALKTLLSTLEGVDQIIAIGESLPAFDYHCPLLSLPLAFATELDTIPATDKYLFADEAKLAEWGSQLAHPARPRIGLAWSGNPAHKNDHNRSIPLETLLRPLSGNCSLVCLQNEIRESDQAALDRNPRMAFFGDDLKDFSDTAALVEHMDLVIAVDTSLAHLAGALGKPLWILLHFSPDWRWLLDREDSPWYPSARLFRQPALDDWDSVLESVSAELARM